MTLNSRRETCRIGFNVMAQRYAKTFGAECGLHRLEGFSDAVHLSNSAISAKIAMTSLPVRDVVSIVVL
jgi:hypothetical protein